MKSQVAVYNSHKNALRAVKALKENNFPIDHVSISGKAEIIDDHIHVRSLDPLKNIPVLLGAGAGIILGFLTGIRDITIPGLGFLYGAGALIGAVAGFDFGLVTGGIFTLIATISINGDKVVRCKEHLNEGRFRVIVNGPDPEIEKAEHILHPDGMHLKLIHGSGRRVA